MSLVYWFVLCLFCYVLENICTKGFMCTHFGYVFCAGIDFACMYVRDENLFCFVWFCFEFFCIYSPFEALLAILLSSSFVHWIDFGLFFTISARSKIPLDTWSSQVICARVQRLPNLQHSPFVDPIKQNSRSVPGGSALRKTFAKFAWTFGPSLSHVKISVFPLSSELSCWFIYPW